MTVFILGIGPTARHHFKRLEYKLCISWSSIKYDSTVSCRLVSPFINTGNWEWGKERFKRKTLELFTLLCRNQREKQHNIWKMHLHRHTLKDNSSSGDTKKERHFRTFFFNGTHAAMSTRRRSDPGEHTQQHWYNSRASYWQLRALD